MPASDPADATAARTADKQSDNSDLADARKKSNWKPLVVAALSATEKVLDGLPIPAAKGCISLVLKVIEATDVSVLRSRASSKSSQPLFSELMQVAADNEDVLKELQARYEDLTDFLRSLVTTDIPVTVRKDAKALEK